MTEKRSQYRKEHQKDSLSRLLKRAKAPSHDKVDVNLEFTRSSQEEKKVRTPFVEDTKVSEQRLARSTQKQLSLNEERENKISRLKKRLNLAILVVILLLILVFVALFNL
ncbi:hypothetical protein [Lactobacillus sp. PV034]|uniref:hypothetical protein n=1 Tax=Lactobacillus sp. PV034 TaxID=2594495 RepID=UPI0022409A63|nr:hypothetical protein [Lactobacillus sp. PV034]QNQ80598.1 hypothetical protein FP432_03060 [Lactobacillus sp. PV034]